jgi:hypothetical protein
MPFLFVDQAEERIARYITNQSPPAASKLTLKLFKNQFTPSDAGDETDIVEADFTGYPAGGIDLTGLWTITPDAPTLLQYAEQEFTSSADQTAQLVWGYVIVGTDDDFLWAIWQFTTPCSVSKNGDKIKVTPKLNIKKPSEV